MINYKFRQSGVTLIELMIGLLIGLFITGGVLSVYIAISQSSSETLKQSRLNQEMSAIMNVITNDLRRAGYWEDAAANKPQDNPYMVFDSSDHDNTTALQVRDASNNVFISDQASGSCIIYSYDTIEDDDNTTVGSADRFGFRWLGAGSALEMKTGGTTNSCSGASWQPVNDVNSVTITGLTFDLSGSTCINVSEPDDEEDGGDAGTIDDPIEYDCFAVTPDTDDALTLIREVAITLSAQLTGDSLVRASMDQTVRVRNDLVRIQP